MKVNQTNKTNWTKVITFYILACAFSWPFFAWRDLFPELWAASTIPNVFRNLGVMWGPGISAIICFIIFRKTHTRSISLTGTSAIKSLLFYFIPYVFWIILTILNPDEDGVKISFFLELIPFGFLMILGEELGWRGFLQDSLQYLKEWKKWLILSLMWEFWHFTRGLIHGELPQIILRKSLFIVSGIILTIIIGKITNRTKSLLIAITIHSWVNIQFEFSHINTHIAGGLSLIFWIVLIWKWRSEKTKNSFLAE